MLYSPNVQLVKWTFPAVALIIGLFWYKRRRIHRGDPGGITRSNSQDKITSDYAEIKTSLYDSVIEEINESFSTSCCTRQETPARVPRKVSENVDIPVRKSPSQSSGNSQICIKTEPVSKTDIQLGSNPNMSYFETIAKRRSTPSFEVAAKIEDNTVEEGQCNMQCGTISPEQNDTTEAEYNREEKSQLAEEHPEDTVKTAAQATYERDSANHSPVSGVLEGSIIDEARSEGSTDSGKGGSINGYRKANVAPTTYCFAMPQHLVGRLIGRYGSFLHSIRTKAEVHMYVNDHPSNSDQKICTVEGNAEGIAIALDLIRKKFPEKRFPQVTLAEILSREVIVPEEPTWIPQCSQLFLIDGVNNDIVVSHILKPNWLFVQIPTHPTYPSLRLLDVDMTYTYNNMESSIPSILARGMLYVANWYDIWVRVCMEAPDPLGEKHKMRLLDHGGYYEFNNSQIRDIRPEYLNLPFQAIEIFLAHIRPKNGIWLDEAYHVIAQICFGVVGQAQVAGYVNSNVYANIYFNVQKYGVISLADELIARGFAEPATLEDTLPESSIELFEEPHFS